MPLAWLLLAAAHAQDAGSEPAPPTTPAPPTRTTTPSDSTSARLDPAPVEGLPSARRLIGGATATCAEDFDGAKWCWGDGATTPRRVSRDPGVRSAAPDFPECTLTGDALTCDRPDGAWVVAPPPVQPVAMAVDGTGTLCVADGQGPTRCLFGLRGDWRVLRGLDAAVELVPLAAGICGRDGDGDVACWEPPTPAPALLPTEERSARADRPFGPSARRIQGFERPTALAAGRDLLCGRGGDGAVRCVGTLGPVRNDRPVEVPGLRGASVLHASDAHLCGVVADEVRCVGDGSAGQLGPGHEGAAEPVTVPLPGPAIDVAAGRDHTCALLRNGEVWCWGTDTVGQLGRGSSRADAPPSP